MTTYLRVTTTEVVKKVVKQPLDEGLVDHPELRSRAVVKQVVKQVVKRVVRG